MIRILTVSDNVLQPSGFGVQHKMLCEGLAAAGHQVFSLGFWNPKPVMHMKPGYLRFPTHGEGEDAIKSFAARWGTIKREFKPDVVLTWGDMEMFPAVWADRPECIWVHLAIVDAAPVLAEERARLSKPDVTVFPTAWARETAGIQGPVIPLGVDTETFTPPADKGAVRAAWAQALRLDPALTWLVCHNTNTWRKNLPVLLEAMPLLDDEYALVLHCSEKPGVGSGGWDLALMARDLGVGGRVRFTGRGHIPPDKHPDVPRAELASLLQACDVWVSPTMGEGFGVGTIEAMACGLPVVITDTTGAREIVGTGGIVVEPAGCFRTPGSEKLRALVTAHGLAHAVQLAEPSCPKYVTEFAVPVVQKQWADLIGRLA